MKTTLCFIGAMGILISKNFGCSHITHNLTQNSIQPDDIVLYKKKSRFPKDRQYIAVIQDQYSHDIVHLNTVLRPLLDGQVLLDKADHNGIFTIHEGLIKGKAYIIMWPLQRIQMLR